LHKYTYVCILFQKLFYPIAFGRKLSTNLLDSSKRYWKDNLINGNRKVIYYSNFRQTSVQFATSGFIKKRKKVVYVAARYIRGLHKLCRLGRGGGSKITNFNIKTTTKWKEGVKNCQFWDDIVYGLPLRLLPDNFGSFIYHEQVGNWNRTRQLK
jgi:hypothetical protein